MSTITQFLLEITPFLSAVLIKFTGSGMGTKFESEFESIPIGEDLQSGDIGDIENAAQHSFEFEQCIAYYDLAIIATLIIFITKAGNPNVNRGYILILGVVCEIAIIMLRRWTDRYFTERSATKAVNIDSFDCNLLHLSVRKANAGIIIANLMPVLALLSLRLPDWLSTAVEALQ